MKTSKVFGSSYKETSGQNLKKYVFLFLRRSSGGKRRDYHIIWSTCPSHAYDMFIDFAEKMKWSDVNIISFSRIVEGFQEARHGV